MVGTSATVAFRERSPSSARRNAGTVRTTMGFRDIGARSCRGREAIGLAARRRGSRPCQGQSGSAHVVVLGNEKGGSGKSTTALHIAVALMKAGQRVATIDLDCRQQSFTRYIGNRSAWARRTGLDLELPVHRCIKAGATMQIADNENSEFQQFMDAVNAIERRFDFIVIDT